MYTSYRFDEFSSKQVLAAAENYQPWGDSRPYEAKNHEEYSPHLSGNETIYGDDYHGYLISLKFFIKKIGMRIKY